MNTSDTAIQFYIKHSLLHVFYPALQEGFLVKGCIGCSIKDFLHSCGIDKDYIINTIQTVFLNSKPVDDLEHTLISDGSVLSLSGAMPGLVGAVMRKKSPFQSFRKTISYTQQNTIIENREGFITIKLFNAILRDTAPVFLQKGIVLHQKRLENLIADNLTEFNNAEIQFQKKRYTIQSFINTMVYKLDDLVMIRVIIT